MHTERIVYKIGQDEFYGFIAYDSTTAVKRPAVLVAHAWKGQDAFARNKAEDLARLGYVGFAVDNYGEGKEARSNEEAAFLMKPLFLNRSQLLLRMKKAFHTVLEHPTVDVSRVGVMGFCFGGLAAIELFRSGVDLKAAVSFHATLAKKMGEAQASCLPIVDGIKGSLLILHGHDDPLVSKEDLCAIQDEMTISQIDWQMNIYGHASHAFTNKEANDAKSGLLYNALADARSWLAMKNFFDEKFI